MEYMEGMEFIHSCLEEDEYVLWRGMVLCQDLVQVKMRFSSS